MKPPLCRPALLNLLLPLLAVDWAEGYSIQSREPKADAVQYQIKPDSFLYLKNGNSNSSLNLSQTLPIKHSFYKDFGGDGYGNSQALVDNGPSDQVRILVPIKVYKLRNKIVRPLIT